MTSIVRTSGGWLTEDDCRLADLVDLVEQVTILDEFPHAESVRHNVLVYDGARLADDIATPAGRSVVQAELARALLDGPGIVVLAGAFADGHVVDRVTAAFTALIEDQRASGTAVGDHFATPGSNDRIWNALEKLARLDPAAFVAYYANDLLALVCSAWLGPGYQVTSQVNVVNPGGAAQSAHCDYHLGFQPSHVAAMYPEHVHRLSPLLTLQGAVAHTDMPVHTGPTQYLPHSQKYRPGYLASSRPEFREYFEAHNVQLALAKGDAVFFNPALFHAAGANRSSDVRRMANLLQISSAFGRAMETVDRRAMCMALFPTLCSISASGVPVGLIDNVIAASAEGYAFPTNLDHDQPIDGLAPPSQAAILHRAVTDGWELAHLGDELDAWERRRQVGTR